MKQAVMIEPGRIEIRDVPTPVPGPGELLLRIRRIGVCGSDVHVWRGKHPYTSYPVVQGHEFCGVVEQLGEGVESPEPGRKVTALPQVVCGRCGPCSRGDYHICQVLKVEGFQAPGCGQELFVTTAAKTIQLPDDFTFEQGALVEPAAVAVHAVARAGDVRGRNLTVIGAGPIGNLVAQVARAGGANVLITDLSDHRLEVAGECGIGHRSNAGAEPLDEVSLRVFGRDGFETAVECVGAEAAIGAAVANIAKGGTIVVVGVFAGRPQLDVGLIQDRELHLIGTLMYRREDYEKAIELISAGQIKTRPLVSKHFPLSRYAQAYRYISQMGDRVMKVFIDV